MNRSRLLAAFVVICIVCLCARDEFVAVPNAPAQETAVAPVDSSPLKFRTVGSLEDRRFSSHPISRAKIPGGWLMTIQTNNQADRSVGMTFVPDPKHEWDGKSLP